jgi:YD repeat-containing protein
MAIEPDPLPKGVVKITKDPNDTLVAEFAYDALSRRIERFTNNDSQSTTYASQPVLSDQW